MLPSQIYQLLPPPVIASRWKWIQRKALQRWVNLPTTVTLRTGERYHLSQDTLADRIIEETFGLYHRLYFPPNLAVVPEDGWILDVGAHHGVYTISMLTRFPRARAIAVEPAPDAIRALKRNIAINQMAARVEVVEAAIDSASGSGSLLLSEYGSWANQLVATGV